MSGQTYYPERTAADLPVFDYGELLDSAEPLFGVYFYHCVLNYNNCPITSQKNYYNVGESFFASPFWLCIASNFEVLKRFRFHWLLEGHLHAIEKSSCMVLKSQKKKIFWLLACFLFE